MCDDSLISFSKRPAGTKPTPEPGSFAMPIHVPPPKPNAWISFRYRHSLSEYSKWRCSLPHRLFTSLKSANINVLMIIIIAIWFDLLCCLILSYGGCSAFVIIVCKVVDRREGVVCHDYRCTWNSPAVPYGYGPSEEWHLCVMSYRRVCYSYVLFFLWLNLFERKTSILFPWAWFG